MYKNSVTTKNIANKKLTRFLHFQICKHFGIMFKVNNIYFKLRFGLVNSIDIYLMLTYRVVWVEVSALNMY